MKLLLGALICAVSAIPAFAQISEVRVGVAQHDLGWSIINGDGDEEKSVALNAEVIFDEPEFLKWALSPQPYIGGTLNVEGETSYGGAGLLWRQNIGDTFYGDFALGVVVHDGILDFDDARSQSSSVSETLETARNRNFYGSRILFRQQLTLGINLSDEWAAEGYVEHISHGGLLSDGPNEGSDAAGLRLNRKF
ncbi:MAG: acyloxyacyl hydrolase [Litorimonas sp.]